MSTILNAGNLTSSMQVDKLFVVDKFNDNAKLVLPISSAMNIAELSVLKMYRSPKTYEGLNTVIRDYECGTKAYRSATILPAEKLPYTSISRVENNATNFLVHPRSRVRNL